MEPLKELPQSPLVEVSTKFKLAINLDLVEKIEYFCKKLSALEWSGVLFYKTEGSFEDNSLKLIAVDMLVQDIGSSAATEFIVSADIGNYIAQNNLIGYQMGLIHSHNAMATFFSGTDQATLLAEGRDRNHFLSLIVNNAGIYSAKITRKINYKELKSVSYNYNTFNENFVEKKNLEFTTDTTVIEAFTLDIIKNEKSFEVLDSLIKELREKKISQRPVTYPVNYSTYGGIKKRSVSEYHNDVYQPSLFRDTPDYYGTESYSAPEDDETKDINRPPKHFEDLAPSCWGDNIPYGKITFNSIKVKSLIKHILSGSPIMGESLEPVKFILSMDRIYSNAFGTEKVFSEWVGPYIEYLVWNTEDEKLQEMGCSIEEEQAILAHDLVEELDKLPENSWLKIYKDTLLAFII